MVANVVVLMQSERGRRLVHERCKAAGLDIAILEELIDRELDQAGKLRKHGLWHEFDEIFGTNYDERED